jgi:hypothetical protein
MDILKISIEVPMTTKYQPAQIAFRYRTSDSPAGVTRETAQRLAEVLGVAETQAIHLALHELAVKVLPQYEPDSGALTPAQLKQVRKLAGKVDTSRVRSSLFDDESE